MCVKCNEYFNAIREESKLHPQYRDDLYLEQLYLLARWPDEDHDLEEERAIRWASSEINEAIMNICSEIIWE